MQFSEWTPGVMRHRPDFQGKKAQQMLLPPGRLEIRSNKTQQCSGSQPAYGTMKRQGKSRGREMERAESSSERRDMERHGDCCFLRIGVTTVNNGDSMIPRQESLVMCWLWGRWLKI